MESLHVRIDRIADFGAVVSLVGIDIETGKLVTIHVDHRPFAVFWRACSEAGLPQPVEYEAGGLLVCLDFLPPEDGQNTGLLELFGAVACPTAGDQAAQDAGQ